MKDRNLGIFVVMLATVVIFASMLSTPRVFSQEESPSDSPPIDYSASPTETSATPTPTNTTTPTVETRYYKLNGWAWSSNIGWISFNGSGDRGGVFFETPNNVLTGWAWSSNIGWIKFGDLSVFPQAPGTIASNAKMDPVTGRVYGWIRACAGTTNGDCWTPSRTDGWDGWISLSGTNYESPYFPPLGESSKGVTFNKTTGKFSGYAWGGDVIGWIDFRPSVDGVYCDNNCGGSNSLGVVCLGPNTTIRITGPKAILNASALASGGVWPYQYMKAGDGDPESGWLAPFESAPGRFQVPFTFYPVNTTTSYYPRIKIKDSNNEVMENYVYCGEITVLGREQDPGLQLWVHNSNVPNDKTKTFIRIHPGSKVPLSWSAYPTTGDTEMQSCTGYAYGPDGLPVSNLFDTSGLIDSTSLLGGSKDITLTESGTYVFKLQCAYNNGVDIDGNPIRVLVPEMIDGTGSDTYNDLPIQNKVTVQVLDSALEEI